MFNEAKTTELFIIQEELELSHFHVAIFNYKMSSLKSSFQWFSER